jgi:hypothetical protein
MTMLSLVEAKEECAHQLISNVKDFDNDVHWLREN